jgi:hypothetical protein
MSLVYGLGTRDMPRGARFYYLFEIRSDKVTVYVVSFPEITKIRKQFHFHWHMGCVVLIDYNIVIRRHGASR